MFRGLSESSGHYSRPNGTYFKYDEVGRQELDPEAQADQVDTEDFQHNPNENENFNNDVGSEVVAFGLVNFLKKIFG